MAGTSLGLPEGGWGRPETSPRLLGGGNIARRWVGFGHLGVVRVDGDLG